MGGRRGRRYPGTVRISVVVPALNEEPWLPFAVASVRAGTRGAGAAEIVVADCGSEDGTATVARELGCRVVVEPGGGVAAVFAADVTLWLAGLLRLPVERLGGALYWAQNRRLR